jgi:hypothetical protein
MGESDSLHVPRFFTWVARSISKHPRFWIKLGQLESGVLAPDLVGQKVEEPIYVCGLARSGSTLLLEILAAHHDTASHKYEDFPFVFTPYWWRGVLRLTPFKDTELKERAHGDRMLVNAASPEAMEEMLWRAFFADSHKAEVSQVLGRDAAQPEFSRFYARHVQKILLAAKRRRYLSKGNYNVTRMGFLRGLFADARFVVPVREPVAHIVSLMRQHERFCAAGKKDAGVVAHMTLAGHYEFGLNRVPINTGDAAQMDAVLAAWKAGDEVRGWALYWAMLYGFVHAQLAADADLQAAALVVRFETLCAQPKETIRKVLAHCDLAQDEALVESFAAKIGAPDYYAAALSEAEVAVIREITAPVAALFGY